MAEVFGKEWTVFHILFVFELDRSSITSIVVWTKKKAYRIVHKYSCLKGGIEIGFRMHNCKLSMDQGLKIFMAPTI